MTERPHVVIASRIFLPEPAAASFRLGALAEALRDAGAAVTVLTATVPHSDAHLPGIDVRRLPVWRDRHGYVRGYAGYLSFDVPLAIRLLHVARPDVIVCEPPPTTGTVTRLVGTLRRTPYVYYAADIWSDAAASTGAPGPILRTVRGMERAAIRTAEAVLSVSPGVTERLAQWDVRQSVVTVGHGVDLRVFHPHGPRTLLDGPYLAYAGTASEVHGATVFVEAFQSISTDFPSARLIFMGQGTDFPAVRQAAALLPPGRIHIMARQPPERAAEVLRGAAATLASVRPGIGYDFAVPTKLYASVACGTPVIYAGPGQGGELIEANHLGWSSGYDVNEVASSMRAALGTRPDPDRQERLALWATAHVSHRAVAERAAHVVLRVANRDKG